MQKVPLTRMFFGDRFSQIARRGLALNCAVWALVLSSHELVLVYDIPMKSLRDARCIQDITPETSLIKFIAVPGRNFLYESSLRSSHPRSSRDNDDEERNAKHDETDVSAPRRAEVVDCVSRPRWARALTASLGLKVAANFIEKASGLYEQERSGISAVALEIMLGGAN